jgi:adenylylsulfate kinase
MGAVHATRDKMLQDTTKGFTVWLTGLPCSGKSTIARGLTRRLLELGRLVEILDGDIVRESLSKGLGFSRPDRDINIRRIGFVATLLTRNGVGTIVSAISPYRSIRSEMRAQIGNFVEVFVDCPLEVCEERDVKGLYAKARAGELRAFTGVDDPYEQPEAPEVTVQTNTESAHDSVEKIVTALQNLGYVDRASPQLLEESPELARRLRELGIASRWTI